MDDRIFTITLNTAMLVWLRNRLLDYLDDLENDLERETDKDIIAYLCWEVATARKLAKTLEREVIAHEQFVCTHAEN